MKDFRVKIRAQNNRLITLIEEKFGTQAEMARQTGMHSQHINALVAMRATAVGKRGWTRYALDIATALGVSPSEIWPEHMQTVRLRQASADMYLDAAEVQAITGHDAAKIAEWRDMLERAITVLPKRDANVIQLRYVDELTYREAGKEIGASAERVRQIEMRALRRMKKRLGAIGINDKHGAVVT